MNTRQKIQFSGMAVAAVLIALFATGRSDALAFFQSPISPLPPPPGPPAPAGPTAAPELPATQALAAFYGITPADIAPGGDYYVPPEFRGMVFRTAAEVEALGLKFVDFVTKPRSHCAIADPSNLGQEQIVYDGVAGFLVRFAVVHETLTDDSVHVCWGAPHPKP